MRHGRSRSTFGLGAALLLVAGDAAAEPPSGQDVATAQALFDEGKRLMAAGNYAEACPKLVESQRIDPGGGTLFAIALCHESEGKTATAWADFNLAAAEARKDRRADREAAAVEHVRALEPKLTRVRVAPIAKVPGLEIRRDGTRVGDAQWGTPLPIDPGEHLFEASAPGKKGWRQSVDVRGDGATVDVAIPVLVDDDAAPATAPAASAAPAPSAASASPPRATVEADASSQRTWALVAGGVGVVATGVGLGFGLSASSKWSEAETACPNGLCTDQSKVSAGEDAGKTADIATGLVITGAVALAVGVVLWLTAPSPSDRASHGAASSILLGWKESGRSSTR